MTKCHFLLHLCSMTSRGLPQRNTMSRTTSPTVHVQPCTPPEAAAATADTDMCSPIISFCDDSAVQTKLGSSAINRWHLQLNDCWAG